MNYNFWREDVVKVLVFEKMSVPMNEWMTLLIYSIFLREFRNLTRNIRSLLLHWRRTHFPPSIFYSWLIHIIEYSSSDALFSSLIEFHVYTRPAFIIALFTIDSCVSKKWWVSITWLLRFISFSVFLESSEIANDDSSNYASDLYQNIFDNNNDSDEDLKMNSRSTSFLRFGREIPSGSFLRFGRSDPSFLRFGRNGGQFLRFGRRSQLSPTANFLRFGRKADFLRFGW